ncbi:MAG: hypothetical protein ABII09_03780 [Planctomycetota bacterium]
MNGKKIEKLLSAHVDAELCDRFLQQAATRCIVKKRALAAAVKLWSELPAEIQARLLDRSIEESAFVELVHHVVDERIKLQMPQKQSPQPASKNPRRQLHDAIAQIKEMVEIERQQPGTIYRVLDSGEQKVLDEFRKLVGPKERKKTRSA